jgi:hypothetical protein
VASELHSVEKLVMIPTNPDVLEVLMQASQFLARRSKSFHANAANLKRKGSVAEAHEASVSAAHNKAGAQWLAEVIGYDNA